MVEKQCGPCRSPSSFPYMPFQEVERNGLSDY